MVNLVGYEEYIQTRASKGIAKDYARSGQEHQEPVQNYKIVLDMARHDPIIATALDLTVDLITFNGFKFCGESVEEVERATKLFNDILDFDQIIDPVIYSLLIFGDGFLELRKNGSGEIKEIHCLETTEMRVNFDKHGEILGYVQIPFDVSVSPVPFSTDEVLYFRLKNIGSGVYSETPFLPIANSFTTKIHANNYLKNLFQNIPPKILYGLENANRAERELFMQNLFRCKSSPGLDLVGFGKVNAEMLSLKVDTGFLELLKYIRNEVLTVLRVPVHWLDTSTTPNRGIGENVIIPYETRIKKIQSKIASLVNKVLMPMLGFSDVKFKWNPTSLSDEKSIIDVAQGLKSINLDDDSILFYLREKGLQIPSDAKIVEPINPLSNGEGGSPQIQKDWMPSRQRMDKKNEGMNSNLNKEGSSDAGKAKLDEMKSRSFLDFNKYPYVIGE